MMSVVQRKDASSSAASSAIAELSQLLKKFQDATMTDAEFEAAFKQLPGESLLAKASVSHLPMCLSWLCRTGRVAQLRRVFETHPTQLQFSDNSCLEFFSLLALTSDVSVLTYFLEYFRILDEKLGNPPKSYFRLGCQTLARQAAYRNRPELLFYCLEHYFVQLYSTQKELHQLLETSLAVCFDTDAVDVFRWFAECTKPLLKDLPVWTTASAWMLPTLSESYETLLCLAAEHGAVQIVAYLADNLQRFKKPIHTCRMSNVFRAAFNKQHAETLEYLLLDSGHLTAILKAADCEECISPDIRKMHQLLDGAGIIGKAQTPYLRSACCRQAVQSGFVRTAEDLQRLIHGEVKHTSRERL